MEINKQNLIDVLSLVKPGVASKAIVEYTDHFMFRKGRVYSYNDEVSLSHVTELNLDKDMSVEAVPFLDLLKKCKDETVDLSIQEEDDAEQILLKGKSFKAKIRMSSKIISSLPVPDGKWKKLPKNFVEACKMSSFSASRNMTHPVLTCLNVSKDNVWACDKFRIAKASLDTAMKDNLLLPVHSMDILVGYDVKEYLANEGWVHFRTDKGLIVSMRPAEGEYPDVGKYLDVNGVSIELPKTLSEVVDRASVLARQEFKQDELVTIVIKDNELNVSSRNNLGTFSEKVRFRYKGEELRFEISPHFLLDILGKTNKVTCGETALRFEVENFVHVISLS